MKVDAESGCWLWQGSRGSKGRYGFFAARRDGRTKSWQAHRLAYVWAYGDFPPGTEASHLCATPHCVNPDHLRAETHQQNIDRRDYSVMHKTHCPRGHELTEENLYVVPKTGWRKCRTCMRDHSRRWKEKVGYK